MIISHHHKFIFVAIPKTGTHSIREAIRPNLHKYDWEQCELFIKRKFPIQALAKLETGHLSCEQVYPYFPKGTWSQYFKFSIVRNPYARFISFCNFYFSEYSGEINLKLINSVIQNIDKLPYKHQLLLLPQWKYVCDSKQQLMIDYIGKLEQIGADLKCIFQKTGLSEKSIKVKNKSENRFSFIIEEAEIIRFIQSTYQLDFELFNYSKDFF